MIYSQFPYIVYNYCHFHMLLKKKKHHIYSKNVILVQIYFKGTVHPKITFKFNSKTAAAFLVDGHLGEMKN